MSDCEILQWDSEFFGRRIARYRSSTCSDDQALALLREVGAGSVDCVYFLFEPSDVASIAAVQRAGARFVDVRVTFSGRVAASGAPTGDMSMVRAAVDRDIPALERIAAVSHRDTRFYADGHFDRRLCDRLYERWIERSCRGYADAVFVAADSRGEAVGYVTCHAQTASAPSRIGLFAVAATARRRGFGRALLQSALRWFADHGDAGMTVATQLRNLDAVRFYQHAGLLIADVGLWYHLWPADGAATVR